MTENELIEIAKEVRDFNATVFVLFISTAHLQKFAKQLSKLRVYDKVWIASEAWATSTTIRDVDGKITYLCFLVFILFRVCFSAAICKFFCHIPLMFFKSLIICQLIEKSCFSLL